MEPGGGDAAWAALEAGTAPDGTVRVAGVAGAARGQAGDVARLRLRGGGGTLRVLEAVDADFAGAWERDLPGAAGGHAGITSLRPNPTSGALTIAWNRGPSGSAAALSIHDVRGRAVARVEDRTFTRKALLVR